MHQVSVWQQCSQGHVLTCSSPLLVLELHALSFAESTGMQHEQQTLHILPRGLSLQCSPPGMDAQAACRRDVDSCAMQSPCMAQLGSWWMVEQI